MTGIQLILLLGTAIGFIIFTAVKLKWHAMISLLTASIFVGLLSGLSSEFVIREILRGFGDILASIGLIVVFGSLIGLRLEKSGAISAFAERIVKLSGRRHPGLVLALLGAILGIPVFCDSGFLVMINMAKSMAVQGSASLSSLSLSLATGLYGTHTLVPPTPGPVAAAANLGMTDMLGWVMLTGILVAIPSVLVTYFFIRRISGKIHSKLDLKEAIQPVKQSLKLRHLLFALMMVLLPLLLISVSSVVKMMGWNFMLKDFLLFLGHPVMALFLGYIIGLSIPLQEINTRYDIVQDAMKQAGPILILTGSGAAFGAVIRAAGINEVLSEWIQHYSAHGLSFLFLSFLLAALLKTAQGSSTSALIISSVILAPLSVSAGIVTTWDFALLISAIGAGSMTISHANDSYFWVVIQMSGFDLKDGLRGMSMATLVQGLSAFAIVVVLYLLTHS